MREIFKNKKLIIFAVIGFVILAHIYNQFTGNFVTTGNLNIPRCYHTATLLNDGRVLIIGGLGDSTSSLSSVEIYDPKTGKFTLTGSMNIPRSNFTATLLNDGRVLIAGGNNAQYKKTKYSSNSYSITLIKNIKLDSAEIYDPKTGRFILTGNMNYKRVAHDATLLPNGEVLITSGGNDKEVLKSAEIYNPETSKFTLTGNTNDRGKDTATLLPNGKVLLAGSGYTKKAELYNPETGKFNLIGEMKTHRDYGLTATLLKNGNVLFTTGGTGLNIPYIYQAEIYDYKKNIFLNTGHLNKQQNQSRTQLLPDGKVLITGGETGIFSTTNCLKSAEMYNPETGKFTLIGNMNYRRSGHTLTMLKNNKVLIVGGNNKKGLVKTAELYRY